MFNPFHPLNISFLEKFAAAGKKHLVRQVLETESDTNNIESNRIFLFTQHANLAAAQQHMGAIANDKFPKIYNYDDESDRQKLYIAAQQPLGYKVYCNVFYDNWKDMIPPTLKKKIKYYIDNCLKWKPSGIENVNFTIFVHYGILYAKLTYRSREARVELRIIEKILPDVL